MTRKQKAESKTHDGEQAPKKAKPENGKVAIEFDEFCKATREDLSIEQMLLILEANGEESSGSDDEVIARCQDLLFYGPLKKCPVCNSALEYTGRSYTCTGAYSEWSSCPFSTRDPSRKEEALKLPDLVLDSAVSDLIKKHQEPSHRPQRDLGSTDKPFSGMVICLSGRLSRTHNYWRREIEKHGGKVSNSVIGATCLVVSPAERDRGGSSKLAEALERGIPVVREEWLVDSIEKQEAQPLDAYDIASNLVVEGKGILGDKQDPSEEGLESISGELKLYGKRGVHKDSKLQNMGGMIFEKDGILYNCAFALCDQGRRRNDFCIMQLIVVPETCLHLYYKKGRIGGSTRAEERLEEWDIVDDAVKEFVRLFEEITGNEFEPWEREKKFKKKRSKFHPIDMDDVIDARYGGLSLRQLGPAVIHCKLEPFVANFMKVLCSRAIYRYAMTELGSDTPDLPIGMLSNFHLKICEEVLINFIESVKSMKETGQKAEAVWSDFSQRWFTLMPSTRPFIFRDYQELADHAAAALETVRDITVASYLIGDMTGPTIDDPLSDRYMKLGCSISPLEKNSDDYKLILNYLEKTYEPVKVGDIFGKAIVCTDAAAEAAKYGFTAVDRPDGFLILAVASLGEQIIEIKSPPEDTNSLEEKQLGVKGLGRKKPDESEHTIWKDNIKVPCGPLTPSGHKESPLKYNEYAVYNPKQVSIRFVVGVKFEEKGVIHKGEGDKKGIKV
ncbi:hypothetical protein L1049_014351 [Liquidambar formosana]|uniref:Poly [ADP-ribose] polymerase n=1 Tax=Liquidambar formosana TaxID=63359 RepID=A0AAP0RQT2_LIQFO